MKVEIKMNYTVKVTKVGTSMDFGLLDSKGKPIDMKKFMDKHPTQYMQIGEHRIELEKKLEKDKNLTFLTKDIEI